MLRRTMVAAFAALSLTTVAAPAASATDPILFVHGWNSSGSTWNTMVSRFQADGWTASELNNWSYDWHKSNATTASAIKTKVDGILAATGATKVDIISHSMGGLSSRYFIKNLGGGAEVDDWVSLRVPDHGPDTANFCFDASCVEMRQNSTFLKSLNSGDETPGAVNYGTWWSPCDEIINPDESVILSGATNHKTAAMSHAAPTPDETVYKEVRKFVK